MSPTRLRLRTALVSLSVDQLVAWGVLYYAYSVLSAPIAHDLQVSPRLVAGAFSLTLLVGALLTPAVGRLLDRVGARPVLRTGAIVAPLAIVGLADARGAATLIAAFAALGVAHAFSLYEPAFRALVEWYPGERDRSRALVMLTSVGGLASGVFVPLTAALTTALGWRQAVVLLAVILGSTVVPSRLTLPPPFEPATPPPRSGSVRPIEERTWNAPSSSGWSMLGVAFALQSCATTATTVCLVWHLVERGQPLPVAAGLAGLMGAAQVPGRVLFAIVQRTWTTERRLPAEIMIQALALIGLAVGSMPFMMMGVLLFGAAGGMMTLERATVAIEWFGPEAFGTRNGQLASRALVARAAAPFAVAQLHAWTSYAGVLAWLALCLVGSTIAIVQAQRHES